jgi:hypothetical protein
MLLYLLYCLSSPIREICLLGAEEGIWRIGYALSVQTAASLYLTAVFLPL